VVEGTLAPDIRYPAAVVRDARHPAAARRFLAFLSSPEAMAVFKRFHFVIPSVSEGPGRSGGASPPAQVPRYVRDDVATTSSSVFQKRGYDFETTCSWAMVTPPRARPATAKAMAMRWSLCVSMVAASLVHPG